MMEVKIKKTTSKKKKKTLYIVALVNEINGVKSLSYHGRYKTKKDAIKKRNELLEKMRG